MEESAMIIIAPNFNSLKQYVLFVNKNGSKPLRPSQCPHCGKAHPWYHGTYTRKADRVNKGKLSLNPVSIFRIFCNFCKRTCSILPECMSPKRWYLWAIQQAALLLTIAGHSRRYIATKLQPTRNTLYRWQARFELMFKVHTFHLCSRTPELGRKLTSPEHFWAACLKQMSLARAMYWVHRAGGIIP
jgi:hypothetical protein